MSKSIYTSQYHYVYRITNVSSKKHYYGRRSCRNCHPKDDLGIKYFSSSTDNDFKKDQKEHPESYHYKIVRICESRNNALELEMLLHEKFDVGINESFYNKAKQTSLRFSYDPTGKNHSEETRKKMSESKKGEKCYWYGKELSEDTRKKMSDARKGEKHPLYGKQHSDEHKKKLSEANKGEKNYQFKGYYVTPFGTFTSSKDKEIKENNISHDSLRNWCKNNDTIISKGSYAQSKYLQENFDESIIGKTFADIGFSFYLP
jgi:group I intron endonuclease